jgi:RNA polymerase sigma factor (sigma-70 family)
MRGGPSRNVLRQLRTLYRFGVIGNQSDEELLDRFLARRDETAEEAFSVLVQRHGPMVLGVCRRVLGDAHEAEDAFQATFLVLARKASSVVRREKVASWLYGVACRTAKEARDRASRRRAREERVSKAPRVEPSDGDSLAELRAILDEELARLPVRYRGAVVLCELEGLSRQQAAIQLGIPEGTLSSRLSRAKATLRERLTRRGVALPVVVLVANLLREASATTLPDALIESTVRAAMRVAAGSSVAVVVSASVASLTEGVLKAMLLGKLKTIVLCMGALAVVVSSAVVLAQSGGGAGPAEADRISAMERKLDRILNTLDRMTGTVLTRGTVREIAIDPTVEKAKTAPETRALTKKAEDPFGAHHSSVHLSVNTESSVTERLDVLEKLMDQVQQRLTHVEGRMAEFEKRIGGDSGMRGPGPVDRAQPK